MRKTSLALTLSALAFGVVVSVPSEAHERFRFGSGCPEPLGTGACITGAIGSNSEPVFEDEINGFDFFLFYEDGSDDGNIISTGGGDTVTFEFVDFIKLRDDKLDSNIRNRQTMPGARETFGTPGRYQNKVRFVDDGAHGYIVKACFQDLVEQSDDSPAAPYVPMAEPLCIEQKWVCGQGSQDPRNNPGDPEFDGRFHQFGCITDALPFGATTVPGDARRRDARKDKDQDLFSDPTPVGPGE